MLARCKLGWRVIVLPPVKGPAQPLSQLFVIKTAAQQCLELARKAGHENATLETVFGTDSAGPPMDDATLR